MKKEGKYLQSLEICLKIVYNHIVVKTKKHHARKMRGEFGASEKTRTFDLLITNQLHYRLCYTSKHILG